MKNLKSNLKWKEYKKKRNKSKVLVWLPNGYRKSYTHYQFNKGETNE